MGKSVRGMTIAIAVFCGICGPVPFEAQAQETGGTQVRAAVDIVLPGEAKTAIRDFYASHPVPKAKPLPPGIRKNLARGKPLPPGIAKRAAPADLHARVQIPAGYELMEVGLDVVLVEVATQVVRDVLMDVIR